jgi:hypothetical protein
MTAYIVGRPRRKRPTDRVNYKLDTDLRAILAGMAEREGRNEGAQVEQLILFYAAFEELNTEGVPLSFDAIKAKTRQLWATIEAGEAPEPTDGN